MVTHSHWIYVVAWGQLENTETREQKRERKRERKQPKDLGT